MRMIAFSALLALALLAPYAAPATVIAPSLAALQDATAEPLPEELPEAPPEATPEMQPPLPATPEVAATAPPAPLTTAVSTATPTQALPAAPLEQRVSTQPGDVVKQIAPGVVHIRRVTADPARINILLFDMTSPAFDLRVGVGEGWLSGRHRTSRLVREHEALAGVNGDLFAGDGLPQGLTMVDGQVMTAPKRRATFAWSRARGPFIGYFTEQWTWTAEVVATDGARRPIALLNTPCPVDAICLYNHAATFAPGRTGDVKVVLDRSGTVTQIVREQRVAIKPGVQVLQGNGAGARWLRANVSAGDRLTLDIRTDPPLADYTQAISGGPIILRGGQFVQDCMCALRDCTLVTNGPKGPVCEDFSTDWKNRHYLWVRMPRTGVGFDRERRTLIVAVVDGYQRGYSRGMTQEEFAAVLREFGADTAMELDGGGSSTMVLKGQVANQPPDKEGERYVANALLFYWRNATSTQATPTQR